MAGAGGGGDGTWGCRAWEGQGIGHLLPGGGREGPAGDC